jgi:3-oxoadipate enol-lactonase
METHALELPTGITIRYALAGPEGAEVLCFVHGASAHSGQFEDQLERFRDTYRVLLVSLRGHGGSTGPAAPKPEDYTRETLARDVLALWDALGVSRAHFVGNSLGGLVGYEILRLAPERLRSLTTFGTTAALRSPKALVWTLLTLQRLLGPSGMAWLFSRTASKDRAVARRVGEMCRSADRAALRHVSADIAVYDYTPLLRRQTLPILLIRGEHDRDINAHLASTIEALTATPGFRLAELAGAGHFANLERPAEFEEVLGSFLEANTGAPTGDARGGRGATREDRRPAGGAPHCP